MNPRVDPVAAIPPVETAAGAVGTPALVSTLYDLMSAMHEVVAPDEEALVVPAVVHLLHAKRIVWLGDGRRPNFAPAYHRRTVLSEFMVVPNPSTVCAERL